MARQTEGFRPHFLYRRAVGKQANVLQFDASSGFHAANHCVGVFGLNTDDFNVGAQLFDVRCNPRDQAASTNRAENGIDSPGVLTKNLHAHSALACNDVGVVERVHKSELFFLFQFFGVQVGIRVAVTHQNGFAAEPLDCPHFNLGRGGGHDDDCAAS